RHQELSIRLTEMSAMTAPSSVLPAPLLAPASGHGQPASSRAFDQAVFGLGSLLLVAYLVLDGLDGSTFATARAATLPSHAVLYAVLLAAATPLGPYIWRAWALGRRGLHVSPAGYELAVLGLPVLVGTDAGLVLWQLAIGQQLAPDGGMLHLVQLLRASGLTLFLGGPILAARHRISSG